MTVNISAENVKFDKATISVPAGAEVTIVFENRDIVPHNIAVYETSAAAKSFFVGNFASAGQTVEYKFIAPEAKGKYFFRCDIHPTIMTGDFVTE